MMYAKLLIPCNVSKIFSQKFIKLNVIDTMLHYFSKKMIHSLSYVKINEYICNA